MEKGYPTAPWQLRGDMYMAIVKMPPGSVPDELLPKLFKCGRPGRGMTLAVAFVDYREGGDLAYREFLVTTTSATLTAGTILKIWVDSKESMQGGRELWFIPKDIAEFQMEHSNRFAGSMTIEGQFAAAYTFTSKFTIPGRWRLPNTVTQESDGIVRRTRSSFFAKLQLGSGTLEIPEDSPVAFLRQGKVVRHVAMRNFTARFGIRSKEVRGR